MRHTPIFYTSKYMYKSYFQSFVSCNDLYSGTLCLFYKGQGTFSVHLIFSSFVYLYLHNAVENNTNISPIVKIFHKNFSEFSVIPSLFELGTKPIFFFQVCNQSFSIIQKIQNYISIVRKISGLENNRQNYYKYRFSSDGSIHITLEGIIMKSLQ